MSRKTGYQVPNPYPVGLGGFETGTDHVGIESRSEYEDSIASGSNSR